MFWGVTASNGKHQINIFCLPVLGFSPSPHTEVTTPQVCHHDESGIFRTECQNPQVQAERSDNVTVTDGAD